MNDSTDPIRVARQLQEQSQRLRADAIRAQIMAAHSLWDIVETRSGWESKEQLRNIVFKLGHHLEVIRRHIHERGHISPDVVQELLDLFTQLEIRADYINKFLKRG